MQSAHADDFFQSDASLAQRERRAAKAGNKHGNPIEMKSKILAAIADPSSPSNTIFIAESAGYVRRVRLEPSETLSTYRGPKSPVTCLAVGGANAKTLFAGSWDKDIWSWDIASAQPGVKFSGHSDFVKAVVCATISGKHVLISGGSDKKIMVWDVESGRRLLTVQDPTTAMMAVQHLAIDPLSSTADAVVVFSAGSDPHIRRWKITLDGYEQLAESYADKPDTERLTIEEHDTSVYRLIFDAADEESDLWTASADGTTKCLSRARHFVADDTLTHGDYVRSVLPTEQWVVTAGRDENVKVWDRSNGKLYCTLEGHFEEVTDLVALQGAQGTPDRVCSVSIDGTVRTWPLGKAILDEVVKDMTEPKKPVEEESSNLMTAEEEAELAELMDD